MSICLQASLHLKENDDQDLIVIGEWWLQGEGHKSPSLHSFEYIVRKFDS